MVWVHRCQKDGHLGNCGPKPFENQTIRRPDMFGPFENQTSPVFECLLYSKYPKLDYSSIQMVKICLVVLDFLDLNGLLISNNQTHMGNYVTDA